MSLKTRSWVKKRVKVTWKGKFKIQKAWKRHLLMNKSSKAKGRFKYGKIVSASESKKIARQLPYA